MSTYLLTKRPVSRGPERYRKSFNDPVEAAKAYVREVNRPDILESVTDRLRSAEVGEGTASILGVQVWRFT